MPVALKVSTPLGYLGRHLQGVYTHMCSISWRSTLSSGPTASLSPPPPPKVTTPWGIRTHTLNSSFQANLFWLSFCPWVRGGQGVGGRRDGVGGGGGQGCSDRGARQTSYGRLWLRVPGR